jgi:L-glyceraldehyde reductase
VSQALKPTYLVVGKPKLTEHAIVKDIATRLGATPAQVLVAWGARRNQSVIPKSVQEERIISNFKQVELSAEDFDKISGIGKDNRTR